MLSSLNYCSTIVEVLQRISDNVLSTSKDDKNIHGDYVFVLAEIRHVMCQLQAVRTVQLSQASNIIYGLVDTLAIIPGAARLLCQNRRACLWPFTFDEDHKIDHAFLDAFKAENADEDKYCNIYHENSPHHDAVKQLEKNILEKVPDLSGHIWHAVIKNAAQ